MGMQKGICMELKEDRSIFLLKSGQFVKGQPAGSAAVGEESYFYPLSKGSKKVRTAIWVPIIAAIAVLALFLSMTLPTKEAFAYVQVEINPGLEMGVSERGNVISMRPLNKDGTLLIERLDDWKDQPLNTILASIFKECVEEDTEDITITTVAAAKEGNNITAIDKMVRAVSTEIANERITIQLKEASREDWRRSVKEHVPVGDFVKKSKPVKIEKVPAAEMGTPAVPKENPLKEKEKTAPVQEQKPKEPAKEKTDKPAYHNNKNTVPGQDKKQQAPAKELKEKPKPQKESEPKQESKPKSQPVPTPKQDTKPESETKPKPKPEKKPEPKSNNKNNVPGQEKKNTNEPAKEKSGNNEKEHPAANKDKVPGQEKKPEKEDGKRNSSPENGAPGPKGNGPDKSGPPGQQKKNKDGKE